MGFEQITYEVAEGVATITLDRPASLNAFTVLMMHELLEAFDRVDADDDVRAVVVTGRGRAFCAGADLSAGGETFDVAASDSAGDRYRDEGGQVALRIYACTKPVIGAINGSAVGVGITMTLPMDIRVLATGSKIGFVFARRGLVPEACSSWFLPRLVGISRALEWVLTGRILGAEEVLEGGLVRSIHSPQDVLPEAYRLAREIATSASPVSVVLSRQLLWRMLGASHPMEAHRIDSRAIEELGRGPDVREGVAAFLDKRQPEFRTRPSRDLPEFYPWWEEPTFD